MSPRKFRYRKASRFPTVGTYRGHQHFTERLLNRRSFLEKSGLTVGALLGAGLLPGVSGNELFGATGATPVPIPGGTDLLGDGRIFHLFLPATGAEPSTITDFNGFVGWAAVGGMGTHTPAGQAPQHLPFESDMRFMAGDFIGTDGKAHHGAFAFIWLDVYTSPAEDVQIHDFNPGITPGGLFWTIAIPENTIDVNFATGEASFKVSDLDVEDYHDVVNALNDGPSVDASVSWDITWHHVLSRTKIRDVQNQFAGEFVQSIAQTAWTGQTATAQFVSDPAATSVNEFSLLARERNGFFFS